MTFLPLVQRELRVAARRASTHWLRLGAAGLALACAFSGSVVLEVFGSRRNGAGLFHFFSWLAWAFALFEGLRRTADCISVERREDTLGLLFLTDLRGWDIVLGKLAPAALHTVYAVLAMVPVLGLSLLMGGVTGGEVARVAVALLASVGLTLAAGLVASAQVEDAAQAWLGAAILAGTGALLSGALMLCAFAANASAFQLGYWVLLGVVLLATMVFIGIACWTTKPTPVDDYSVAVASGNPGSPTGLVTTPATPTAWTDPKERRVRDPAEIEWLTRNPALWLALRGDNAAAVMLAVTGGSLLFFGVLASWAGSGRGVGSPSPALWLMVMGAYGLTSLLLTWEAARLMADLRRSGVMELLLATPLRAETVVHGCKQGLLRRFRTPVVVFWTVQSLLLLEPIRGNRSGGQGELAFLVFANAWLVAELFGLASAGLYFGFRYGNAAKAFGRTVFWTVVLPLIVLPLSGAMCLWPFFVVALIAKPFMLYGWANTKLRTDFARLAVEPLGTRR